MKQGTVKTLGAAALGAAFAVTAAGAASAAPAAAGSDATGALESLPVKDAAKTVSGLTKAKPAGNDVKTKLNSHGNKLLGGRRPAAASAADSPVRPDAHGAVPRPYGLPTARACRRRPGPVPEPAPAAGGGRGVPRRRGVPRAGRAGRRRRRAGHQAAAPVGLLLGGEQDPQRQVEQELRAGQQTRDHEDHAHRRRGRTEATGQPRAHSADHPVVAGADQCGGHEDGSFATAVGRVAPMSQR